jgi:hypothetical protein
MSANSDEHAQTSAGGKEPREAEMRALAQTLSRESRKSAIFGFIAGVIVVVGLGATFYAALQSRSSLQTQMVKTDSLQSEVTTKNEEVKVAKQRAATTSALLSATVENLQTASPAVSASATSAVDRAFEANPSAAQILIRVYIHTHSREQHKRAAAIAGALRSAGMIVPGIDVKPESVEETQVHYYSNDKQSLGDVASIVKVVAGTGIPVSQRQVPQAASDKARPRAYGLWLASGLQ